MRGVWRGSPYARKALRAAAVGVVLAGAAMPQAARAQFFGWGNGWGGGGGGGMWGGMDPGAIYDAVTERGFRVIAPLRRNGPVFLADVLDRRGRRERLVVAAADAQILRRFFLDDPRLPGSVPAGAERQDMPGDRTFEQADRGAPRPPAVIPGIGGQDDDAVVPSPDTRLPLRAPRAHLVDRTPETPKVRRDAPAGAGDLRLRAQPGLATRAPEPAPRAAAVDPAPKPVIVEPPRPVALAPAEPVRAGRPRETAPAVVTRVPEPTAPRAAAIDPAPKPVAPEPPKVVSVAPSGPPEGSRPSRGVARDEPVTSRPDKPVPPSVHANAAPRIVSGSVTGAPIPARVPEPPRAAASVAPKDAKPADVPAAPLD